MNIHRRTLQLAALAAFTVYGCYGYVESRPPPPAVEPTYVDVPPPEPPPPTAEIPPPAPGPDFIWIRGYHRWDGHHYEWRVGHYERRPSPYARHVPGHWERRGRGQIWIDAHWQ